MGEIVHQAVDEVTSHFEFRSRLSLGVSALLAAIGLVTITVTVPKVDGSLAVFIMGVGACICAFQMFFGWFASDGHAKLAQLAAHGHAELHDRIGERLDRIEAIERQTGDAVVYALDAVREQRGKRGS